MEMLWKLCCLSIFCGVVSSFPCRSSDPVVSTAYGSIRGVNQFSRNSRMFASYKRIPYAQPPIGQLRFKAPEPPSPWNTTLDGSKDAPICIQKNYFFSNPTVEGEEDCLYLNVYVPAAVASDKALLPVVVSIHWGGFVAGRGTSDYYSPEYIMDKDVILVTFNYRLGVFGFLSSLDDEAPGNYAFKDQVAVLEWVQQNIESFGGNRHSVTLIGTSAGAGSTHLHLLSPLSKDLFHRAISQSGSGLALWATPLNQLHQVVFEVQCQILGCPGNTTASKVQYLRNIDAKTFVESGDKFKYFSVDPLMPYTSVIETKTPRNPKPFLTKLPIEYIRNKEFMNVPWIIGTVQNEGSLRASALTRQSKTREALNKNYTTLMMKEMFYDVSVGNESLKLELHKAVQNFYMKGQEFLNENDPENIQGFLNLWSDRSMTYPIYQTLMIHSAMGHTPLYFYNFEYQGKNSYETFWAATNETVPFNWGASHCDDLIYLVKSPALFPNLENPQDIAMSNLIVERWTNFAITGKPQRSDGLNHWDSLANIDLDHMENANLHFLNITGSASGQSIRETMTKGFYKDRMLFWASQPLRENFPGLK